MFRDGGRQKWRHPISACHFPYVPKGWCLCLFVLPAPAHTEDSCPLTGGISFGKGPVLCTGASELFELGNNVSQPVGPGPFIAVLYLSDISIVIYNRSKFTVGKCDQTISWLGVTTTQGAGLKDCSVRKVRKHRSRSFGIRTTSLRLFWDLPYPLSL